MTNDDKAYILVMPIKRFGRVDYKPINDAAKDHCDSGQVNLTPEKVEYLVKRGYRVEEVS